MKKLILIAIMAMGAFFAQAQTKGMNTVGLGMSLYTSKNNSNQNQSDQKSTNQAYSLSFGHFIKDNQKLSLELQLQRQNNDNNHTNGYGVGLNYQKYYPLFKGLYAFAGGGGDYFNSKSSYETGDSGYKSHSYSASAFGGLSWFASKRIAIEADLFSVGAQFGTSKNNFGPSTSSKFTAFYLSTASSAGIRVHILF
jgi:hypothetical protein